MGDSDRPSQSTNKEKDLMWMVRFPPPPVGAPYLNVSLSSSTWSWISAPEGKEQTAADSQRVCASVCVPLCDFKSVKRTEEKSGREWYCQQKKHHYNNESLLKWLHHYTDLKLPPDSPLTVKTTSLLVGVRKDLTLGSLRPLKIAHTSYSTHLLLVKNLCVCVCFCDFYPMLVPGVWAKLPYAHCALMLELSFGFWLMRTGRQVKD